MSSLGVRLLLAANRILPQPALPGQVDPFAYAQWEYDTSGPVVRLWHRAGTGGVRSALDLGCGLGGKTHRLVEACDQPVAWTALDIALDHVRKAEAYHQRVGLTGRERGVAKLVGDVASLPVADASFDRIVTADTLEHFPQPRLALQEMRRCLRDDGRLILLFNPWGSPRGSHLGDLIRLPWCQLLFSRQTLQQATLAAGERRAAAQPDPQEAAATNAFAKSLVDHFVHHVHPTRVAQFRQWLKDDRTFEIESELHVGPGPLRDASFLRQRWAEEWLTASYGAVLRPAAR